MPAQYIYEPWTAPRSVQEKAGCIVGTDSPRPIVDHSVVSKLNIERMKEARAAKNGDSDGKKGNGKIWPASIFVLIFSCVLLTSWHPLCQIYFTGELSTC